MANDSIKIFGNVCIPSSVCPECQEEVLIIQGEYACCGAEYVPREITKYVRVSEPMQRRRYLSKTQKEIILKEQNYKCFYCERSFGKIVHQGIKAISLKINYDHQVPYAYSQNNFAYNFVAACHICNNIKSSMVFDDVEKAKIYIKTIWDERKLTD